VTVCDRCGKKENWFRSTTVFGENLCRGCTKLLNTRFEKFISDFTHEETKQ